MLDGRCRWVVRKFALTQVDVHAFWVFEAKMAFLLSVSATRKGAEDLLDAGIFETLSMCSFISVQPYVEDSGETPIDTR